MVFKALQTYSSGEVVRWIEEPAEGAEEPEHPAPQITLVAAEEEASDTGSGATNQSEAANADQDDDSETALPVAIAGLVLGAAGVVTGLVALRGVGAVRAERVGAAPPAATQR